MCAPFVHEYRACGPVVKRWGRKLRKLASNPRKFLADSRLLGWLLG